MGVEPTTYCLQTPPPAVLASWLVHPSTNRPFRRPSALSESARIHRGRCPPDTREPCDQSRCDAAIRVPVGDGSSFSFAGESPMSVW